MDKKLHKYTKVKSGQLVSWSVFFFIVAIRSTFFFHMFERLKHIFTFSIGIGKSTPELLNIYIEQEWWIFHLLVTIDGWGRKLVIGKKEELAIIEDVGISNLTKTQLEVLADVSAYEIQKYIKPLLEK